MLSQDIAKGLGMLVVVQLHGLQLSKEVFYPVVVLFSYVMPFFIFMSGYNYRSKGASPLQNMKKRVFMLLKVYAAWTFGIFIVMCPYFLIRKDGSLSEIMLSFAGAVFSESGCKMIGWQLPVSLFQHVLGPYWFLQYLITASVIFYLLADYALRSVANTFSMVSLLSAITLLFVHFKIYLPWGLHCAPLLAAMMITGASLAKVRFLESSSKKRWLILNSLVCLILLSLIQVTYPSAGILGAGLLGETAGDIEVVLAMCFAVFGSYFLINLAKLLEKIPVLSTGLIWLGQHSLIILCIHRPIAYIIRDCMGIPHFISGNPLYIDRMTPENVIAFLLIFVIMVPIILCADKMKKRARR